MRVTEREKQNLNHTVRKKVVRELKAISTLKFLAHFHAQSQGKTAASGSVSSYGWLRPAYRFAFSRRGWFVYIFESLRVLSNSRQVNSTKAAAGTQLHTC